MTSNKQSNEQFLSGGGEMGELIRSMDWSKTPLGPIESWPQSLRTSVSLCLSSTFPILIAWGEDTIQLYNDSYRPICGAKHPESMGMNFRICWETALEVVGDAFTRGQQGEGTYIKDQRMFLDRFGYLEEAFMTFSFAPIRDESGGVGGIFHPITETTEKILSGRRTQAIKDIAAAIGKAKSTEEMATLTSEKYVEFAADLPFCLIYRHNNADGNATLLGATGLPEGSEITPKTLNYEENSVGWPLYEVLNTNQPFIVDDLQARFGDFSCAPYEEPPRKAIVLPLKISGQEQLFGYIVAGVSSRRALDNDYLNFYEQLSATYHTAVSNIYAYEQEQKRAEALAEIDRSKTTFFSNVSHEFRTPLTLMLGNLEELLSKDNLSFDHKPAIDATHRNAQRLLKLVNNLLDYSRVEAGRVQAIYQQIDLSEFTADLASSFRSLIEKAGMELVVDCETIHHDVYADHQMWEKIVLNLISNAFKYTLSGTITVSLKQLDNEVLLSVADTGVGIPKKELPNMFDRFHRVENNAGRTHEGSGIGLSLVKELVLLHSGTISVESIEGSGSTFFVKIPIGKDHLPEAQLSKIHAKKESPSLLGAFLNEASNLLTDSDEHLSPEGQPFSMPDEQFHEESQTLSSILVVDDNADMRDYLKRLLAPHFLITTAVNGRDALDKISLIRPDVILSDVMMPVMDGKEMLKYIRSNPKLVSVPVIFLSARAGEEAKIDGLESGADDYLVKPFSAVELLTKLKAQIKISNSRKELEKVSTTLALAMEAAGMGTWTLTIATGELNISERSRIIHGIAGEEYLDYFKTSTLIEEPYRKIVLDAIQYAVDHHTTFDEDYRIQPADGSKPKWLNTRGQAEYGESGEAVKVIGTILDITETKEDEERKNDFIGMVSHELKTPLTSLNGFTQILQNRAKKNNDQFTFDMLERVVQQVKKMSGLINGFLNLSRLESGKIHLNKKEFILNELVEEVTAESQFGTETHEISYDECDAEIRVYADRDKISSVISNLISNAVKYSPKGKHVTINCKIVADKVQVSVSDEGMGIKQHDAEKLFERFYRVDNHYTTHISGFGIGLYLCSEIITRHEGRIWVESELGVGSTFYFELPQA
ncbi:ATP-binding protein [Pedobacter sp. PWIIR3]